MCRSRKQDHELFPPKSRCKIVLTAQALQQQGSHAYQHTIAIEVSARVVHALEVVEIEERQRERPRVAARFGEPRREGLEERAARGGQGCQRFRQLGSALRTREALLRPRRGARDRLMRRIERRGFSPGPRLPATPTIERADMDAPKPLARPSLHINSTKSTEII